MQLFILLAKTSKNSLSTLAEKHYSTSEDSHVLNNQATSTCKDWNKEKTGLPLPKGKGSPPFIFQYNLR